MLICFRSKVYPVFTKEQVAQKSADGKTALIIVNGDVLDISKFCNIHPGGKQVLLDYAGKDATKAFYELHRHEVSYRISVIVNIVEFFSEFTLEKPLLC